MVLQVEEWLPNTKYWALQIYLIQALNFHDVREGWLMDDRINPSHTIVYEEQPFYDSHCFNKDIPAFANKFNDKFMKTVDEINTERKLTKIKKQFIIKYKQLRSQDYGKNYN